MKRTAKSRPANLTGHHIRQARLARSPVVTQQKLAEQLVHTGIVLDQTAISKIEQGRRGVLDCELAAIARCLDIPVSRLFGEQ